MLCWFLLYSLNQLKVHLYPLPVEPPPSPHSSCLDCHSALGWARCYAAASHQPSVGHMVVCICQWYSQSSPPCVHRPLSTSCPSNMSVSAFFLVAQSLSRVWLCDPMDLSTSGLPVPHHLLEFVQTHVHSFRFHIVCDTYFSLSDFTVYDRF